MGGGGDAAEQQLLKITSAPSGVISEQTDWNRPTEASPRESEGWTEEEWKGGADEDKMRRTQLKRDGELKKDEKEMAVHRSRQNFCNLLLFPPNGGDGSNGVIVGWVGR